MSDGVVAILIAAIAAILGGGSGFIVHLYQAKTERRRTDREAKVAAVKREKEAVAQEVLREQVLVAAEERAVEVALKAWQGLASEREQDAHKSRQEAQLLRERLTKFECQLEGAFARLEKTESELQTERDRNTVLENKVDALEKERAAWSRERAALKRRIDELEACRQ